MQPTELKALQDAVEQSAAQGIKKVLISLGVDVENPLEVQKDLAFARKQREASEQITKFTKRTLIGLVIVGACSMLWTGFIDALHN